jgi:hypothetical protein
MAGRRHSCRDQWKHRQQQYAVERGFFHFFSSTVLLSARQQSPQCIA